MSNKYQICTQCVMDTTDPSIKFDDKGICVHCNWFKSKNIQQLPYHELLEYVHKIKEEQKGCKYHVILGISGGIDSSYLLYYCVEILKLKPLVVHCDNGWNTEQAVHNIELLVKKLNVDLLTYIINWEEFRELQRAFFYSNHIDLEMVTDHAMNAIQQIICKEYNIKYSVSGQNYQTESILPRDWAHDKMDFNLIEKIAYEYGTKEFISYPHIKEKLIDINFIAPLNYIDYNKEKAKRFLKDFCNWQEYGGKHSESIFTKFYQNYILPKKFNIDKRKAHLSSMILANQMTRSKALEILKQPIYSHEELKKDKQYILKKLKLSNEWFENYLKE